MLTFLLGQFINWSLFSICKSSKTYTLSYYDSVLREMVKLVAMESKYENSDYCEPFLKLINEMLHSFASEKGNPVRPFNPTILQSDEHISNYREIDAIFGNTFFEKRTTSCEYHFDKSVNKH